MTRPFKLQGIFRVWNTSIMKRSAVFLALCAQFAGCGRERPRPDPEPAPYELVGGDRLRVREDLLPMLKFERVNESEVAAEVGGLGNVSFAAGAAYALRVPFNGFVETVDVDVGQIVTDNQPLATIRSSDLAKLRADLERMTAEIEAEQDAYKRAVSLVTSGAIPDRKIVGLRSRVASLQAQAGGIRQSLQAARVAASGGDLLELHAPRGGHIIVRRLDPGELVEGPENTPAFVVADPQRLVVKASFPERDAPLLAEGFSCRITVPALGDITFPGRMASVVRAIDPATSMGSETQRPFAISIVAGLLFGTPAILFVLPVLYARLCGERSEAGSPEGPPLVEGH